MSQGKYYGLKKEEGDGMTVQGEDDKFFDADYAYLMVSGAWCGWSTSALHPC